MEVYYWKSDLSFTFGLEIEIRYSNIFFFVKLKSTFEGHNSCDNFLSKVKKIISKLSGKQPFFCTIFFPFLNFRSHLLQWSVSSRLYAPIQYVFKKYIHPFNHPSIQPSTHSFNHPLIHSTIHSFIRPFNHPSIRPSIHSTIHAFIQPPTHSSVRSTIHPSVRPSIHPSIHSFIRPSVHPSILQSVHPSPLT